MRLMAFGRLLASLGLCLGWSLSPLAQEAPGPPALAAWIAVAMPQLKRALRYPASMRRARRGQPDSVVMVRFAIDDRGRAGDVTVARSSGFPAFDRAAVASVARAGRLPPPPIVEGRERRLFNLPVRFVGKRAAAPPKAPAEE